MERYHPLLELAPRDVVARAIAREGMAAKHDCDAARLPGHAARQEHRSCTSDFPASARSFARMDWTLRVI